MTNQPIRPLVTLTRLLGNYRKADDASLLALYKSVRDPAAFDELVHRHGPLVLGVCRRMLGNVHDADDAFQATFLILVQKARSIRKPNALAAWLYGTAVRTCQKARARQGIPLLPSRVSASKEPLDDVAWKEIRGLLDDELSRLSAAYRDPLVLCYIKGLSREEAASQLGLSKRTLMRRLEVGRDRLRNRLMRRGVVSVGLGAFVLSPTGLKACVPHALATAAVTLGIGGTAAEAAVRALATGASLKLLYVAAGLLLLVATGGGLGWAAASLAGSDQAMPAQRTPEVVAVKQVIQQLEPPKLDGDGRPLPEGALHRIGSRRFRIEGINDFALPTPDGKYILVQPWPVGTGYQAQGLMLLDAETGLRVRMFEDSRRVPVADHPAAFSADGKSLFAVADDQKEAARNSVHMASEGNPRKRSLFVWDVSTGKLKAEWLLPSANFPGESLVAVHVTPDGRRLFISGSISMGRTDNRMVGVPGVHVLDAATGKHLGTWENAGHPAGLTVGGKEVVTFGMDLEITARDAETGKVLRTFPLAGANVVVAISPDGATIAAASAPGEVGKRTLQVRTWVAATGREIRKLTPMGNDVDSRPFQLVFAADGKTLCLGTMGGNVLRWDLSDGSALPGWRAHDDWIRALFLRPGTNELVTGGWYDATLRRWNAVTAKEISSTDAYRGSVAIARTPDGKGIVLGDWTGRVDFADVTTGRVTRTLRFPPSKDPERSLTLSPDGRFLLDAAEKGKLTIWDAATGNAVREIPPPERQEKGVGDNYMSFNPDGLSLLVSQLGFGVRLLTWPDCKVVWQQPENFYAVFSPDGRQMVSGSRRGQMQLRDAKSGAVLVDLRGDMTAAAAFSPDGRLLVNGHSGGSKRVVEPQRLENFWLPAFWQVRNAITGEVLKEVKESQRIASVAFSPSGWLLAVASDNSVRVYDTPSWHQVARFDGHEGTVSSVFFGPDDATLVSASSDDGTALVWSLKPPISRQPPDEAKLWAALAGDGPTIRQAVWAAAQHPEVAIRLFRAKWPIPKEQLDPQIVAKLIADLDNPVYAKREAAMAELNGLGRRAEDALRKVLAESPSLEVKKRADKLLTRWGIPAKAEYSAEEARELRAAWALELAGTIEAQQLLADWAKAKVGNRLCGEAAAALKRIETKAKGGRLP